ncbi:hypothetical protein AVEN_88715-1 [Araneus ventricosus]|uniref:Uncharacterized protein n=1 Tax=Araneus ventricosus TaxID=182803 RepID=A0A4Y2V7Q2_ARAVE|nr:hypothetical protein AVEN_34847-1 [Araneus ventricosus]GBO20107.1 hypothetical protein AVEN_88715-1 [Araneus ventricosus]
MNCLVGKLMDFYSSRSAIKVNNDSSRRAINHPCVEGSVGRGNVRGSEIGEIRAGGKDALSKKRQTTVWGRGSVGGVEGSKQPLVRFGTFVNDPPIWIG